MLLDIPVHALPGHSALEPLQGDRTAADQKPGERQQTNRKRLRGPVLCDDLELDAGTMRGVKMELKAELNEGEIKLAIDFWLYNKYGFQIKSGKDVVFYTDPETATVRATCGYTQASGQRE